MNLAKQTESYINTHPSVRDALKKDLINYSKLARQIATQLGIDKQSSFEAILIACRRYQEKLDRFQSQEENILSVLKKSNLELKNKMVAVVLKKNIHYDNVHDLQKLIKKKAEPFHLIEGANAITLVTTEDFLEKIDQLFHREILKVNQNLVEITLRSPEELETTPGVVGYLYSLFAQHGINIMETMSCYTDTLFLIKEKDIATAMKVLKF